MEAEEGGPAFVAEMTSRIGTFIKRAEQALVAEKSRVLRPFDLTVAQYASMLALHFTPGLTAAQLARIAVVTPQTMATTLANLEGKELIARTASPVHAKVLAVTLTPAGEELVLRADVEARAVEAGLRRSFTDEEAATLVSLLQRSAEVLAADVS